MDRKCALPACRLPAPPASIPLPPSLREPGLRPLTPPNSPPLSLPPSFLSPFRASLKLSSASLTEGSLGWDRQTGPPPTAPPVLPGTPEATSLGRSLQHSKQAAWGRWQENVELATI